MLCSKLVISKAQTVKSEGGLVFKIWDFFVKNSNMPAFM